MHRVEVVASHLPGGTLPTVDVSAWLQGAPEDQARVAELWDHTFRTVGFCFIVGFESVLPQDTIAAARAEAERFFALPAAEKLRSRHDGVHGYLAQGDESVARTLGAKGAPPDLVEALGLPGYGVKRGQSSDAIPWLSAPWLPRSPPGLVPAAARYYQQAQRLNHQLMRLSERALDLPDGHFASPAGGYDHPGCFLRFAHYPAGGGSGRGAAGARRYGEHTDYDGFTILHRQPGDRGLQVRLPTGWVDAVAPPGSLTVNIGDLLARWTNDRWRATMHRVANPEGSWPSRLSVAFFSGPHPETEVACLPTPKCRDEGRPPRYPPILARDNVQQKLLRAATAHGAP